MLKGIDISEWQSAAKTPYNNYDFIMMRASYGVGYEDAMLRTHVSNVKNLDKLFGFYHYCYPNLGTSPIREADWFVSVVKKYIGQGVLALDFESKAFDISDPDLWALQFLNRVYETTGVKPLLYCSAAFVKRFPKVHDAGYGLWIAQWGVNKPEVDLWNDYTMWQYRGSPLDLDYFNGDKDAWEKLAKGKYAKPEDQEPVTPPVEKKDFETVAKEIIQGKWGNGKARFDALTKAGYTSKEQDEIQDLVNKMIRAQDTDRAVYYTVQPGDSLWAIAQKYGTTWQKLQSMNGIKNARLIYPGQKIRVK